MRLQKYLSAAGVCSRREAETYISAGRVLVNGRTAGLGDGADSEDKVTLDGKPVHLPDAFVYLMLNKPKGYVTTLSDEKNRPTVGELVKDAGARVVPIGRLDLNSEGLLLFSNDGALVQALTHPSREVKKTYHVTVSGENVRRSAALLETPLADENDRFLPAEVSVLEMHCVGGEERGVLSVTIREGKNREVRRMCAVAGLAVHRLRRVSEGGISLGNLPAGHWRRLTGEEIAALCRFKE